MKACDQCGGEVAPSNRVRRFCSEVCSRRWHRIDWKRRHRKAKPRKPRTPSRPQPYKRTAPRFAGIDCETIEGELALIVISDGTPAHTHMFERDVIGTLEAIEWLLDVPRWDRRVLVGFGFDYDTSMILRDVGHAHLQRLAESGKVLWGDYLIRHISGKMLQITHRPSRRTVTIWDLIGFARQAFVAMVEQWKLLPNRDTLDFLRGMKNARPDFTPDQMPTIRRYTKLETRLMAEAAKRIWVACDTVGVHLSSYYGGGSIASAWMRKNRVEDHRQTWDDEPLHLRAMYGGRAETALTGLWPRPVYVYDLRSAYPHALRSLPCLAHGEWSDALSPTDATLCNVRWDVGGSTWGPFPVRRLVGSLGYPSDGEGWYWWPEIAAAMRAFPAQLEVIEMKGWQPGCDHDPFAWVQPLLDLRAERVAAGDEAAAKILKLGLNAVYGKLAQRRGRRRWTTPVWSGMVTSRVRAQITDAIATDPDSVIAVATDSIFSIKPLPLEGQWAGVGIDGIMLAQSGVYWWLVGETWHGHRARGFNAMAITIDDVIASWLHFGLSASIEVPHTRFVGYRQATANGGRHKIGVWVDEIRALRFECRPRRRVYSWDGLAAFTRPPSMLELDRAEIVDAILGLEDFRMLDLETAEQPDMPEVTTPFDLGLPLPK